MTQEEGPQVAPRPRSECLWGQRVSITLAFFKAASGMPVAGGNEFLTEHMVFSRDGQLGCPHAWLLTSATDECTLVSRLTA